MVNHNNLLENTAKALAGESFVSINSLSVSSGTSFDDSPDSSDVGTELGSREVVSISRIDNITSFNAIRSGVDVVDVTNGDVLSGASWWSEQTGGILLTTLALPSISQTTAFDIEFDFDLTINRR